MLRWGSQQPERLHVDGVSRPKANPNLAVRAKAGVLGVRTSCTPGRSASAASAWAMADCLAEGTRSSSTSAHCSNSGSTEAMMSAEMNTAATWNNDFESATRFESSIWVG